MKWWLHDVAVPTHCAPVRFHRSSWRVRGARAPCLNTTCTSFSSALLSSSGSEVLAVERRTSLGSLGSLWAPLLLCPVLLPVLLVLAEPASAPLRVMEDAAPAAMRLPPRVCRRHHALALDAMLLVLVC